MSVKFVFVIFVVSYFGFESESLVLIAAVPGRCLSFTEERLRFFIGTLPETPIFEA